MCFSFFKLKSNNTKAQRSHEPPTRYPTSPSNDQSMEFHSSHHDTTSSSYNKPSAKFSISSRDSLSSLKHSLAENPLIYDSSQIRSATNNFRVKPFHSSSSSTSWRCVINRKEVAVTQRKLRRPIDAAKLRRMLTLICKSHHLSLVKLYGASISENHISLVYEYVHGASLSECLNNPRNPSYTILPDWLSRVQIAADIAHGIDYVHNSSGAKYGFVHNHIKSSSIIVTEPASNAKLCHFGTAQLCGEVDEAVDNETEIEDISVIKKIESGKMKFEGTRGYMSPEFQSTGIPTLKSDVFAFGVVILELLSGAEPVKMRMDNDVGVITKVSLIETAREAIGDGGDSSSTASGGGDVFGRLRRWVDWRLKDSYPVEVVERMVRVALACVQEDPDRRPDMNRVAGQISKMYLDSKTWAEHYCFPTEISISLAPR
ncbi:hypothetical protein Nepgr_015158 [Nepenthes gracilis]|uniref:Protein kinase domain-containing protein n=1 Tax=Nepenthes gracilis TaxID=150966 RepID=A0AAD3XQ63_NEPGR|nr:hypothetical protein Nepgr_015158 [Nepenthes gracilis]